MEIWSARGLALRGDGSLTLRTEARRGFLTPITQGSNVCISQSGLSPQKPTGRDPQFELYSRLRDAGVEVVAEYKLPAVSDRSKSGHFFADLAVFRKGHLVALCECKHLTRELGGRQRENYEGANVPYIVAGHDNLELAFQWLERAAWPNGQS